MSQVAGTVTVYEVAPSPGNRVRLEMVIKAASFPDFAVDLDAETAIRVGMALVANGEYVRARMHARPQAAGGAHGG